MSAERKGPVFKDKILNRPEYRDLAPGKFEGLEDFDVVEPKLDGMWGRMEIEGRRALIYSRHGQLKADWRLPLTSDTRTVIHGEYLFGSNWAIRNGMNGQFIAFDCTQRGDTDVSGRPLKERRGFVAEVLSRSQDKRVSLVQQVQVKDAPLMWADLVLAKGYEGLVFKNTRGDFGAEWARMKRAYEVDYVCMGFEQSSAPKYKGKMVKSVIGGLFVNGALTEMVRVAGITEAQRAAFFTRPQDFKGKVFTASGKGVFPTGLLRHPAFERWHQEKRAEDCTLQAARKVGGYE